MKNLSLFTGMLLFLSSCDMLNKKCKEAGGGSGSVGFYFDIPYTVTPSKDTFKLGDTLWLESTFSNQMYNRENGRTYAVNDFNFKIYGAISDLKTNPCIGTANFILVNPDGTENIADRNGVYFYFNYKMQDGYYKWKSGLVMTQQGLFALGIGNDIGLRSLKSQSPPQRITECNNEWVTLDVIRSNGSGNTYLLNDAADPYVKEPGDFAPFEKGGFIFYVKP